MDCFIPLLRNPDREWVSPAAAATTAATAAAAATATTAAAAAAATAATAAAAATTTAAATAGVARSDGAKPPSPHLPGRMLMKISDLFSLVREISYAVIIPTIPTIRTNFHKNIGSYIIK
jgi:hypothetical protein